MTMQQETRVAGGLYLTVGVFGGFALGYVVPLGAAAGPELVRWGAAADFVQLAAFLALAAVLRRVLGASASAWGGLMTGAVTAAVALMAAGDAAALAGQFGLRTAFAAGAQVFFGLWLVPLAVLLRRSGRFPRWLPGLLAAGAAAYGLDTALGLLAPEAAPVWHGALSAVPAAAEIAAVAVLLAGGKKQGVRLTLRAGS